MASCCFRLQRRSCCQSHHFSSHLHAVPHRCLQINVLGKIWWLCLLYPSIRQYGKAYFSMYLVPRTLPWLRNFWLYINLSVKYLPKLISLQLFPEEFRFSIFSIALKISIFCKEAQWLAAKIAGSPGKCSAFISTEKLYKTQWAWANTAKEKYISALHSTYCQTLTSLTDRMLAMLSGKDTHWKYIDICIESTKLPQD